MNQKQDERIYLYGDGVKPIKVETGSGISIWGQKTLLSRWELAKTTQAINFIREAHKGQFRKYTGEPFIVHPFAVAGLVTSVSKDINLICAAFLHDTIEDTDTNLKKIHNNFGDQIAKYVFGMTDTSRLKDGNRKIRKKIYREHLISQPKEVKTIKLADMIDNMKSIIYFDPNFANIYLEENKILLSVLTEGDKNLYKIAESIINNYYSQR